MADAETPFQQELGQEDLADPRESQAVHREHPSAKEYIRIGIDPRGAHRLARSPPPTQTSAGRS